MDRLTINVGLVGNWPLESIEKGEALFFFMIYLEISFMLKHERVLNSRRGCLEAD